MMYSAIPFLKSTPQKTYYIESTMMALRLLVSEIWWHSGHFLNGRQNPTGEIWLGTIAKFTWFGMVYICAKFHAFTTKCTIHSILVT